MAQVILKFIFRTFEDVGTDIIIGSQKVLNQNPPKQSDKAHFCHMNYTQPHAMVPLNPRMASQGKLKMLK